MTIKFLEVFCMNYLLKRDYTITTPKTYFTKTLKNIKCNHDGYSYCRFCDEDFRELNN